MDRERHLGEFAEMEHQHTGAAPILNLRVGQAREVAQVDAVSVRLVARSLGEAGRRDSDHRIGLEA
jgi:hypothetical protein